MEAINALIDFEGSPAIEERTLGEEADGIKY